MKPLSISIRNFKGIKRCEMRLDRSGALRIFTLVGLNESGKTTVLEAINAFGAGDEGVSSLYASELASGGKAGLVPKSLKANFTDNIAIQIKFEVSEDDWSSLLQHLRAHDITLADNAKPETMWITQYFRYENSTHVKSQRVWHDFTPLAKKGRARTFRELENADWQLAVKHLTELLPRIYYFPTFLFDIPPKIFLEKHEGETPTNAFYRRVIQHVLDSLGHKLDIQVHIVDRVRAAANEAPFSWLSYLMTDRRAQVDAVALAASAKITKVIMDSWNAIFGRKIKNRQIEIDIQYDEANDRIYARFFVRQGAQKFELTERSLGFRWFFSFLLLTYFRAQSSSDAPVVFLFDEPASNLHGRAQQQLMESLPRLAGARNMVIYTTHSHHMVNPRWLSGTFIVRNNALDYDDPEEEAETWAADTDVVVQSYRDFVSQHSERTTYFLPVLEALDYQPSYFEHRRPGLIVEGKTDYAALMLAAEGGSTLEFDIIPANGAGNMDPVIGLLTGWALPLRVLLDDDAAGRVARDNYIRDWGLTPTEVVSLDIASSSLAKQSMESWLAKELASVVEQGRTAPLKKVEVQSFLQERLALADYGCLPAHVKQALQAVILWASKEFSA